MPDAARIAAVRAIAEAWADPEYDGRLGPERATLDAPNLFTEASVLFAVNQAMAAILDADLERSLDDGRGLAVHRSSGETPMAGYAGPVASYLGGWDLHVTPPPSSPVLVPAFLREVEATAGTGIVEIGEPGWLEGGSESFGVAIVDGHEREADWEGLAEDALLYEGRGAHSTRILLAPPDVRPDALLDACAAFRGLAPVHPDVPGRLAMPKAFLEATGTPHAYGDDLEFLVSQGAFEPQPAGHIRWVVAERAEAERLLEAHAAQITAIATREGLPLRLPEGRRRVTHGEAHRPTFAEALNRI